MSEQITRYLVEYIEKVRSWNCNQKSIWLKFEFINNIDREKISLKVEELTKAKITWNTLSDITITNI